MEARFACGSRVLFLSFAEKCGSVSHIFLQKDVQFRPTGGDIPRQTRDRLIHGSTSSFVIFAHFVVFVVQTPTA
jgi:hypothetical protein